MARLRCVHSGNGDESSEPRGPEIDGRFGRAPLESAHAAVSYLHDARGSRAALGRGQPDLDPAA